MEVIKNVSFAKFINQISKATIIKIRVITKIQKVIAHGANLYPAALKKNQNVKVFSQQNHFKL